MRRWSCVPMIALCLLLSACGSAGETNDAQAAREPYQEMSGCTMEAEVTCGKETEDLLTFTLKCGYVPDGTSTVEVLAPEAVAGVQATLDGKTMKLVYDGACLNTGTLSSEELSPATCLPVLMNALRNGWLLEEDKEDWNDVPCLRLCLDQTGKNGGKILTTIWLKQEDGTPLYSEVAVDDEIILQAEFTSFQFGDIVKK